MNDIELWQGDCLELMRKIPDGSIDLVVTDPPYKTITGGKKNGRIHNRPSGILQENKFDFKCPEIKVWMPELYRVLKTGTHCYVMTNYLNMEEMLTQARSVGFKLHNILVWEKNTCTPSQWYMKNCEYILFLRKGKAKWINNIGSSKTAHHYDNIVGGKKHPTEKPVPMLEFYIDNSSSEGDRVLDPFMGSGSTGEACVNTGRKFVGIELEPDYFRIAKQRIEEAQKNKKDKSQQISLFE